MAINLAKWKEQKKKLHLTFEDLAEQTKISRRQLQYLFQGEIDNPRVETVQAIEHALGLGPQWTEEEIAQGVGNHAVVLSDKDRERLTLLGDGDNVLGEEYVDTYLKALELLIRQKKSK